MATAFTSGLGASRLVVLAVVLGSVGSILELWAAGRWSGEALAWALEGLAVAYISVSPRTPPLSSFLGGSLAAGALSLVLTVNHYVVWARLMDPSQSLEDVVRLLIFGGSARSFMNLCLATASLSCVGIVCCASRRRGRQWGWLLWVTCVLCFCLGFYATVRIALPSFVRLRLAFGMFSWVQFAFNLLIAAPMIQLLSELDADPVSPGRGQGPAGQA